MKTLKEVIAEIEKVTMPPIARIGIIKFVQTNWPTEGYTEKQVDQMLLSFDYNKKHRDKMLDLLRTPITKTTKL